MYPFISVSNFEENTEPKSLLNARINFSLGVCRDKTTFDNECVNELHFSQIVMAIYGMFRWSLELYTLQLIF